MPTISPLQIKYAIATDRFKENSDAIDITIVGHGSLMFCYRDSIIHVDPYSAVADYRQLPKADLILITHEHPDHLDKAALDLITKPTTHCIVSRVVHESVPESEILDNGDHTHWQDVMITAFPAYNLVHKRPGGEPYHPKGRGNAYLLKIGGLTIYIAADTENIPEMDRLAGKIDIAFMPKNLPFTMDDGMFFDAVTRVAPRYLYPYHFDEFSDGLRAKIAEIKSVTLLIRPMSNRFAKRIN